MNSSQQYDGEVLIVGGGPAGSVCAYHLAKAGKKVILIDKENFPRDKICGDFVSPIGLNELKRMGIWELPGFEKTTVITGATVYLDGVPLLTKELPSIEGLLNYGRVIPRYILDNWLIEAAKKEGVKVLTPCKLENYIVADDYVKTECIQDGEKIQITTKVVIGADGSCSKVARILNGKKPNPENQIVAVRAYFEDVNCISKKAELFFTSNSFPGYYWFFPTGPTTANVGIGMMLENFPKKEINLKKLLLEMIEKDESFKAKIGNGRISDKIVGFPLSIYNPKAKICNDRVLLIGDAAGFVNSINGEGMQYAMQSGRWASECIVECFSSNDFSAKSLNKFETKVRDEIGYDMNLANVVMQFIRNRNFNPLWMKLFEIMVIQAKKDEKYANIAGGILSGMVHVNEAISFYFIRKSIYRGIVMPFQGANGIFRSIKHTVSFIGTTFIQVFKQRADYWNWIKEIYSSGYLLIKLYCRQNTK
jgi:geranylgeranyl reductase family protein